jgi:hypothetical protein
MMYKGVEVQLQSFSAFWMEDCVYDRRDPAALPPGEKPPPASVGEEAWWAPQQDWT